MGAPFLDLLAKGLRRRSWPPLRVHSHPRSGTHLLAHCLKKAFFPDADLDIEDFESRKWGHWADRLLFEGPIANGMLLGGNAHGFPDAVRRRGAPIVYIYRDGRGVALSLWRSKHLKNPAWDGIDFSEFLRRKMDWAATPGRRVEPRETLPEHWARHVTRWHEFAGSNVVIVRYEDLVADRNAAVRSIAEAFPGLPERQVLAPTDELVGISPNAGRTHAWREYFSADDEAFFDEKIGDANRFLDG